MFFYKFKKRNSDSVLAVCDLEVMGKDIDFKGNKMEIRKSFYGEKKANEEEILEKAEQATIINAMGDNIVSLLIENNVVDKENVLDVGVKHAQVIEI